MLTEKEASQLSDTEFKAMVIKKLTELSELKKNYQKRQGKYNELTANYINMKKETETINKGQEERKKTISELKNTEEGEGGSGSHTNSTQDLSGNTNTWWRNYSEEKTEQEQEKSLTSLIKLPYKQFFELNI